MRESTYRRDLVKTLQRMLPGCVVLKNDPTFLQGVPDILILFRNRWAMLEVKMDPSSSVQPNQTHYIEMLDEMSFASFINPESEEDVLYELQRTLRSDR